MRIGEFQKTIEAIYLKRDAARGLPGNWMWFSEEVGELARALKRQGQKGYDRDHLEKEFADVLAWLSTLASTSGIELEAAVRKYADGCPRCHKTPCAC